MTRRHCGACGRPLSADGHDRCASLLNFDPPRFCALCGFRLDVQVFPDGYRSSCRECRRRAREQRRRDRQAGDQNASAGR